MRNTQDSDPSVNHRREEKVLCLSGRNEFIRKKEQVNEGSSQQSLPAQTIHKKGRTT
jgi:hypothetical protein